MEVLNIALATGIVAGANAYVKYLKASQAGEPFMWDKMGKTVVLAVGVAVFGSYFGLQEDVIIASPLYVVIGDILENAMKYLKRRK